MPRLTFGLFILIASLLGAYFVVLPKWREIQTTQAQTKRLEELNGELARINARMSELTKQYNALDEANLRKVEAIAPKNAAPVDVLGELETLATRNNLELPSVDVRTIEINAEAAEEDTPSDGRYGQMAVTLGLKGSYQNLQNFLKDLERNSRLIEIDDLSFGAAGDSLAIALRGTVFYQPGTL